MKEFFEYIKCLIKHKLFSLFFREDELSVILTYVRLQHERDIMDDFIHGIKGNDYTVSISALSKLNRVVSVPKYELFKPNGHRLWFYKK